MFRHQWPVLLAVIMAGVACQDSPPPSTAPHSTPPTNAINVGATSIASMYALDFVGTAASGWDMNDAGDVVGKHYTDPGCGSFCLPPEEIVLWRSGARISLPLVTGYSMAYQFPTYLNNQGFIAGEVGIPGSTTHAALWSPSGSSYIAQDLGSYAGTSSADVQGLDDQGRMVGWATQGGAIPTLALPFMWSQSTGMVDLRALGYPNERPAAMSGGGKVVTTGSWYQLGNPASAVALPPLPRGFVGAGSNGSAINDNGDQAHMLVSTSTQNLRYPFRLSNGGTWQQISSAGSGNLSRSGIGDINAAQDISFTALSTAMIAAGPAGLGQSLGALVSPAYPGATLGSAGAMNSTGAILVSAYIGRSPRLMKLVPVTPCTGNCLVVSSFVMVGRFVEDPAAPGSCYQGGRMYNTTTTTLTLTDENGVALGNATVRGRYMDDYWTDVPVSGITNASGVVAFTHKGLCGVGAIAFLVEGATLGTRTLDRTRGMLASYVIPSVGPPPNQAPVARFTYSCNNGTRSCSFNGSTSSDDVGISTYRWSFGDGTTGSGVTPSHTYATSGTYPVTLTVTDGGGLTNAVTQNVTFTSTTNQPPISDWTVSCQPAPTRLCTFDGTASRDPDGTIVAYKWTNANGQLLSNSAIYTRTFAKATTVHYTLTVTDNAGATAKLTRRVQIP